jgi:type II secretory pathway component PulM
MSALLDPLRNAWAGLNEREKRLVGLLGATLVGLVIFGVFYVSQSAVADMEEENARLKRALADIGRARSRLAALAAERESAERRFATKAPALGSFVEATARQQSITVGEVVDQPEETSGRYTKRAVRVRLQNVALRPTIDLLAAIENSPYPVALERLQVEHYQPGDQYNVQIGVAAYDRQAPAGAPTKAPRPVPGGAAGPPTL